MPKPPAKNSGSKMPGVTKPDTKKPAAKKPDVQKGPSKRAGTTSKPSGADKPNANAKAAKAMVKTATKISEAGRRHAEELLARIERRKESINEDFYDIGEALRELLKKKLYIALGYSSFDEMLSARNIMSRSQAHRLIALVSELPREKALAVGPEKGMLLLRYVDATPEVDTAASVLEKGTIPGGKAVVDASTRELREASKQVRAQAQAAKKKKTSEAAEAARGARAVQAALRKQGARGATAIAMRRGGEDWLRIEMPAASADLLFVR